MRPFRLATLAAALERSPRPPLDSGGSGSDHKAKETRMSPSPSPVKAVLEDLLRARQREGRIREGHGDLHAEHVCFAPEDVYVFDCVEFSLPFRCNDVASEVPARASPSSCPPRDRNRVSATRLQTQGTAVAIEGAGVLLRGPAASGKSSLALRLMEEGAVLIADDLVEIRREGRGLTIDLPAAVDNRFRGAIERRGSGIEKHRYCGPAPLVLVVDLRPGTAEMAEGRAEFLGLDRPLVVLDPFRPNSTLLLHQKALRSRVD